MSDLTFPYIILHAMLIRSVTISVGSIATAILLFSGTVLYFDRKIDHVLGERGRPGNITRISDNTTVTSAAVVNQSLAIVAEKKLSFDDQIANSTLGVSQLICKQDGFVNDLVVRKDPGPQSPREDRSA